MLVAGQNPPVFTSATYGRVATGAAAVQISTTEKGAGLIRLTAPSTNTAPIYYGFSSTLTTANGIPIEAGTEKFLFIDSLDKVWVISAAAQSIAFEVYR